MEKTYLRHYTIPFFIPHKGCPFACIFCQQRKISGQSKSAILSDMPKVINEHLATIPKEGACVEVGFFGGSFTAIPVREQYAYLKQVRPFIKKGLISGIRLSTRPDFINIDILKILKEHGVRCIELGVQSVFDDVLDRAGRGHSASDVRKASALILKKGFMLGHQMMVGLPGSSFSKELATAKAAIEMGAAEVRIYPVIVIKGTELASMWRAGDYNPLSEEEAVKRCARLISLFERNKITILRCGLHPSEGLLKGDDILDGPFHQAFGQKVRSYMCREKLKAVFGREGRPEDIEKILFNPKDQPYVFGYRRENAVYAESALKLNKVFFRDEKTKPGKLKLLYKNGNTKTVKAFI